MFNLKYRRLRLLSIKELFEIRDMLKRFKEFKIEIESGLEEEVNTYLTDSLSQNVVVAQYY